MVKKERSCKASTSKALVVHGTANTRVRNPRNPNTPSAQKKRDGVYRKNEKKKKEKGKCLLVVDKDFVFEDDKLDKLALAENQIKLLYDDIRQAKTDCIRRLRLK